MLTLGIESTCDETACAVVEGERNILSNVISSQVDLHSAYGGVIPELACRRHIDIFPTVLSSALHEAKVSLHEIDLIAVAEGPGLIGALLIGINFAKGLSFGLNKPLIGVNHVEAHLYAAWMSAQEIVQTPALGLVVSGGHTVLVTIEEMGTYKVIGKTQDDAVGETFDKVASLLSLPYPGGPKIETLAQGGDPHRYFFKVGQIKNRPYDFSFSGLKTGLLYHIKGQNGLKSAPSFLDENEKRDIAASFQHLAFSDIVTKSLRAAEEYNCKSLLIGGGVSNNHYLRTLFATRAPSLPLYFPRKDLTLDNAAMIAGLGGFLYQKRGQISEDLAPKLSSIFS